MSHSQFMDTVHGDRSNDASTHSSGLNSSPRDPPMIQRTVKRRFSPPKDGKRSHRDSKGSSRISKGSKKGSNATSL
eukprot:gene16414-5011_t